MSKTSDGAKATAQGNGEVKEGRDVGAGKISLSRAENMVLVMDTPKGMSTRRLFENVRGFESQTNRF